MAYITVGSKDVNGNAFEIYMQQYGGGQMFVHAIDIGGTLGFTAANPGAVAVSVGGVTIFSPAAPGAVELFAGGSPLFTGANPGISVLYIGTTAGFTPQNPGFVALTGELPAGTNVIGAVAVATSLPAGGNNIGGVNLLVGGAAAGIAGNPVVTADANGAAFQGAVALTSGTSVAAARSVGFICTASGNITLTLANGSSITLPLTAAPNFQTLPFAATAIALSGGAAGSFWNLV